MHQVFNDWIESARFRFENMTAVPDFQLRLLDYACHNNVDLTKLTTAQLDQIYKDAYEWKSERDMLSAKLGQAYLMYTPEEGILGKSNIATKTVTLGKDELIVADKSFLDANGKIDWEKYAPNGGYVPGTKVDGVTLDTGKIIDRYGNQRGSYVSPVGVPYNQRALPYVENPNAYHQYEVVKPIENISMGKIAKAFKQAGGGIQYELPNSIEYLISKGYLKEIK
jgi:hypothetical protein